MVIAASYVNHVDSSINDQYRSLGGARRFLYNIVRYPGCGNFSPRASFVAFDATTGAPAGVVAVSMVNRQTGHVTQLCVHPTAQGRGLGSQLLATAMDALRRMGAPRVSLTVTAENRAVDLYRRAGFREVRRFLAYVWERDLGNQATRRNAT